MIYTVVGPCGRAYEEGVGCIEADSIEEALNKYKEHYELTKKVYSQSYYFQVLVPGKFIEIEIG